MTTLLTIFGATICHSTIWHSTTLFSREMMISDAMGEVSFPFHFIMSNYDWINMYIIWRSNGVMNIGWRLLWPLFGGEMTTIFGDAMGEVLFPFDFITSNDDWININIIWQSNGVMNITQ